MCLAQTGETVQDVYDLCGGDKIRVVHYRDGELLNTGRGPAAFREKAALDLEASFKVFDHNGYHGYFGSEIRWSTDPR